MEESDKKTYVAFFVPLKGGKRRVVDVIAIPEKLEDEDSSVSYTSILKKAQSKFDKKHSKGWSRTRHHPPAKMELYDGNVIGIKVEMKPPRGWKG